MSQGISGNARPTIFNRGTVRRRIMGGYVQCGRTSSRAVGSHEAFFGKDTSLPAVYATGQSSGRGSLDAEDDGEPTVEDPVSGR
ncbi:BnaAnng28920D [Brassica napus]|uniref:BnaAnng28920D protein n=1 Tax=Brassica napus TaxID=3708 RepID=A0A078JQ87_BRANA|nr:BnaAnng28920D [Brassica napus]